jgi:hypothetical protein
MAHLPLRDRKQELKAKLRLGSISWVLYSNDRNIDTDSKKLNRPARVLAPASQTFAASNRSNPR